MAHAPLGHSDVLDEVEFKDGSGLEGLDIVLLQLFEKRRVFCAEHDGSGRKAMFNGVL